MTALQLPCNLNQAEFDEVLPELIRQLSWLHVSDFHFRMGGDHFSQEEACRALIRYINDAGDSFPKIRFVLVTGDVANSGKAGEYSIAHGFFTELSDQLSVPPHDFFFVPGNHDVDRSINWLAYEGAKSFCTGQQAVDQLLGSSELQRLLERQESFWSFVSNFTDGQQRTSTTDGLAYISSIPIDEMRFDVLGLNSSWLCGCDGEDRSLLIGERQIIELTEGISSERGALCLALSHHPIDWLKDWDQTGCNVRLLPLVDLFHRGHLHHAEVTLGSTPQHPCLMVAAGAGHASRFFHNSFNVVSLELDSGECTIEHHEYLPKQNRYERTSTVAASVTLKGEIPGGPREILEAIESTVREAQEFAGYMTGLITGLFKEVPLDFNGSFVFIASDAVDDAPIQTRQFLSLRNTLRLYPIETPVSERIASHREKIVNFVSYLRIATSRDAAIAAQVQQKNRAVLAEIESVKPESSRPHALALLEDLSEDNDWLVLESESRRYVNSNESDLTYKAKSFLSEALIHSDQTEKKMEGASLARSVVSDSEAGLSEYLLASAAAEVISDESWSLSLARDLIAKWPEDVTAREYLQGLSLRMGSTELRDVLNMPHWRNDVEQ